MRLMSWRSWRFLAILVVGMAGCSSSGVTAGSTTTLATPTTSEPQPVATTSGAASSTTSVPDTTTSIPVGVSEWVIEPASATMPDDWELAFVIPYGEEEELLGSAPGGENLMLGPDYGAQAPDESWWFLDAAKQRLAHYDSEGVYLDSIVLGPEFLSQGIYFQYQLLHVLADGTLVASRFGGETTSLLVVDEAPSLTTVAGTMLVKADDGEKVFAFDPDGGHWAVDPRTGVTDAVDYFQTQAGDRYMITLAEGSVIVSLPDVGVEQEIPIKATIGDGEVHASIEVATTADGTLHLFMLGLGESDESVQLAGYASVAANGTVGQMQSIVNPFTPADPGSPAHIGAAYGGSSPWFMVVGEEGVEVYKR